MSKSKFRNKYVVMLQVIVHKDYNYTIEILCCWTEAGDVRCE